MKFEPDEFQVKVGEVAAKEPKRNILVKAVAGSGKTTVIFQVNNILEQMRHKNLYLVFNKRNQVEAEKKFDKKDIVVQTFNAFGNSLLPTVLTKYKFKQYKAYDFVPDGAPRSLFVKLFDLFRSYAYGIPNLDGELESFDSMLNKIIDKHSIEIKDKHIYIFKTALESLVAERKIVDFNDQLYLPCLLDAWFPKYDTVFVDECQDLNPIKIHMLKRLLLRGARVIAVGDSKQAIYGFAGADTESIGTLTKMLDPIDLPLSVNYRCSQKVIKEAQKFLPEIQACRTAPEGAVYRTKDKIKPQIGDFILCRVNAPLIKMCTELLKDNIPAKVLGRDIGEKLIDTLEKFTAVDFTQLDALKNAEIEKARQKKNKWMEVDIEDRYATISILFNNNDTIEKCINFVKAIFAEEAQNVVILSSIHKSKGLETPQVYLIKPDMLPHPKAKEPWELAQEDNLHYVAVTRARQNFIYVDSED